MRSYRWSPTRMERRVGERLPETENGGLVLDEEGVRRLWFEGNGRRGGSCGDEETAAEWLGTWCGALTEGTKN
ncbi:hypothetical protein SLE2022_213030 [Rubroshorea leprosula]